MECFSVVFQQPTFQGEVEVQLKLQLVLRAYLQEALQGSHLRKVTVVILDERLLQTHTLIGQEEQLRSSCQIRVVPLVRSEYKFVITVQS